MGATLSIAKREFRSYFDSPIAYVVICGCMLLLGLFFFNDLGSFGASFWQANRSSVEGMFDLAPLGLILVCSVVTMRLLAEERRSGTLEMLITLPVRDRDVILGKFLGAWGLVCVLILVTSLYPMMIFGWPWDLGTLDSGPIVSGYLGLILYSAAAVSIGLLISALTESQIIALFITLAVLVLLHVIGSALVLEQLPDKVELVLTFLSLKTRLTGFVRGMVNTRDVIYFLSIIGGCLMGSFWALERRKWA
jgi:ABC-2 type transport system permease protein